MRIGNLDDRLVLINGDEAIDVARESADRFSADPGAIFSRWSEFTEWARSGSTRKGEPFDPTRLGPPVPAPPQVFGIGLNYRDHAQEAGLELPDDLLVFTKFPSSVTGPRAEVSLPSERVDWEVELVIVIGKEGHQIPVEEAWRHVAGLTIGQDLSERRIQFTGNPPQFSMGKSYPGFAPTGPWVVTPEELDMDTGLAIGCTIDDESVQAGTTQDMVFSVTEMITRLSAIVTLLPGDLIFTGTPAGVGATRTPARYLKPGELLTSTIQGIGEIQTRLV